VSKMHQTGWVIWHPQHGIYLYPQRTRAEAIMQFCVARDWACYEEAKERAFRGDVWPILKTLTDAGRARWRKEQRQGYIAVRVSIEVADYRAETPHD